jgi:hypothetical protein
MKFPSVKYLTLQAKNAAERFSLPLFVSLFAMGIGIMAIDDPTDGKARLLFTCSIGLALSLGFKLLTERRQGMHWLSIVAPLAGMLAYWLWLAPINIEGDYAVAITYAVLLIVVHLFVAISPYIGQDEPAGFWRYNETLFMRIMVGGIFSAVLFVGLALAIAACENLFNLDINHMIFAKLWIVVVSGFNTWFFLAGIPANYDDLNTEKVFPKALKIFTQYILIPLVTLYMVILYAYGIRILVQWSLPRGWVSMLILCYAMAGILAMLLVTPLRDDAESPWVRFFSRFFFIATLPLIVLLYVAIMTRINSYGITESRYYLIVIGAWLGFISLYFIFSRKKNIKMVPVSLVIMGLMSLWGPWGAFSMSERSQLYRLKGILAKNYALKDNEKIITPKELPMSDMEEVRSIVKYLVNCDKAKTLQPFLAANITLIIDSVREDTRLLRNAKMSARDQLDDRLLPLFCTNYYAQRSLVENQHVYEIADETGIYVNGYSRAFDITLHGYDSEYTVIASPDTLKLELIDNKGDQAKLVFRRDGNVVETIELQPLIKKLAVNNTNKFEVSVTQEEMTLDGTGPLKPHVIVKTLHVEDPNNFRYKAIRVIRVVVLFR